METNFIRRGKWRFSELRLDLGRNPKSEIPENNGQLIGQPLVNHAYHYLSFVLSFSPTVGRSPLSFSDWALFFSDGLFLIKASKKCCRGNSWPR